VSGNPKQDPHNQTTTPVEFLANKTGNIHYKWGIWQALFTHSAERVAELNKTISDFLAIADKSLLQIVIVDISTLIDKRPDTVSLYNEVKRLNLDELDPITKQMNDTIGKIKRIQLHRHKYIGHNDDKVALTGIVPPGFSPDYFTEALNSATELLCNLAKINNINLPPFDYSLESNGAVDAFVNAVSSSSD
jgi:HEPN superfamily AbiU2-like protein